MFQWNVPLEQGQGARSDFFSDFCGFSDVHTLFQWNKKSPNGPLFVIANEKYRDFCSSGMFQWNKKSEQALNEYLYYDKYINIKRA